MTFPYPRRREATRAALAASPEGSAAGRLLVTDLTNIRYLTGFSGSNAALLLGADAAADVLCTDDRYRVQVHQEAPDIPVVMARESAAALVGRAAGDGAPLAFEAASVSVAEHGRWLEVLADLVPVTGLVEGLREVKDEAEIAALRAACAVADAAWDDLLAAGSLRPGRTEAVVAGELELYLRARGAEAMSFETIIAGGANAARPHHRPGTGELRAGDLVVVDFGAVVDGYHSDCTRTVVLGPAADWQREIHALVDSARAAGVRAAVSGARGGDVDAAARSVIEAAGHGGHFGHATGHGVGLDVHEGPRVARGGPSMLVRGSTITVEPGVYLPGRGGVRIEDTVVVRDAEAEVLTSIATELLEL